MSKIQLDEKELNNYLRLAGTAVLCLLAIFLVVKTINEAKAFDAIGEDSVNDLNHAITVSGHADVEATPDVATFSWTVTETGKSVEEAQNKAADKSNKAIAYLKSKGVSDADISNQNYNTNESYDYTRESCPKAFSNSSSVSSGMVPMPPCPPQITGYTTNQTVEVKIHGVKQGDNKVGEYIAGVGAFGVKASSAYFTFDKSDTLKQQARFAAIRNAREQAQQIARALGVHLGKVITYSDNSGNYPVYAQSAMKSADSMGAPVAPEIPNGSQKVSSDVSVTYSVR